MLSIFGRAAAGRALSAATVSTASKIIVPVAGVRRLAPIARSFTASASIRFPAEGTGNAKPKKTTAAKKKPADKKKKPAAKEAPKKKKKVLTPEEKEKQLLAMLRERSLPKTPKNKPASSWAIFVTDNVTKGTVPGKQLTDRMTELSAQFKDLSEHDKARLEERAQENKEANKQALKAWIESHSVEVIYMANLARRRLARKSGKQATLLHDERMPKLAPSAYSLFVQARHDQVSEGGVPPRDIFRKLGHEWTQLSEAEKQQYEEAARPGQLKAREARIDVRDKAKAIKDEAKKAAKAQ